MKMVNEKTCAPPEYKKLVTLLDGRQTLLRPIRADDKKAIVAFFDRLSTDTRFLRFHYAKGIISPEELDRYCCIDYYNSFALVAELSRNEHMEIIGVGRYVRLPCTDVAEFAFVVEDKEQRNGIGTHLLKELVTLAREREVKTLVAELLNENIIMLDILRKFAPDLKQVVDGNSILVTIPI
jgi:GNAT superfamily N-acetyltransferase